MYPVFFDTCVLLKSYLRDTVLTLAESGVYRPLWSSSVLTELAVNLRRRGATDGQIEHRLGQMKAHFPDAEVTGYQSLIEAMTNHPKDRHVLAAAIRGGAETLVTDNLRDFPTASTSPYDTAVVHQDDFLLDQLDLSPGTVMSSLHRQVSRYRREPRSVADLLVILGSQGHGCPRFAAACRTRL
ncbi:PIN domain-containing protein [Solihabitans fulvus]|uniref:PIN domain-containing protein n=1 Tax=Solihabitans fulvus TaxID=1892852 RepID=A0A5B2XI21_9PSEU|nr:PIN domain-containing protein [Solihabitans fulvus]